MAAHVPALLLLLALCLKPTRAGSHFQHRFSSALSEELPGFPQYTTVTFVDNEQTEAYTSWSRRREPRAPWMRRIVEWDPQYWERLTNYGQTHERNRKYYLKMAMDSYNQTAGLHTFQVMHGCELQDDGSIRGFYQFAYDGHDFLSLDMENMKFTATMEAARVTADRWNQEKSKPQYWKGFLEHTCIEWLQEYMNYGKERLLRRVPPQAMISRRKSDTATTLTCYAFGFYPREIEVKWVRNEVEVDWKTKVLLPNTDGTYQIRTTVELPEGHEKDYRCLVDHIGLEDVITKVYEEESGTGYILVIISMIVGVGIVVAVITVAVIWKRNHPGGINYTRPYSSASNSCT